ncbi:MAG: DoxX family protein, partial [Saprospiraceae bacterium]|nr:DoxX family protein [Saprospiraceae bacterium]
MTLREPFNLRRIAEWALVFVVTLSMLAYGLGKYWQFGQLHDPDQTVSELSGMQLMWAFYGYSKTFPMLLGIAEVLGALLLLVPRTRILGALLLSILLINIIIQDIIYGVHPGALFAACLYQLMLLFILGWHRKKLYQARQSLLLP